MFNHKTEFWQHIIATTTVWHCRVQLCLQKYYIAALPRPFQRTPPASRTTFFQYLGVHRERLVYSTSHTKPFTHLVSLHIDQYLASHQPWILLEISFLHRFADISVLGVMPSFSTWHQPSRPVSYSEISLFIWYSVLWPCSSTSFSAKLLSAHRRATCWNYAFYQCRHLPQTSLHLPTLFSLLFQLSIPSTARQCVRQRAGNHDDSYVLLPSEHEKWVKYTLHTDTAHGGVILTILHSSNVHAPRASFLYFSKALWHTNLIV